MIIRITDVLKLLFVFLSVIFISACSRPDIHSLNPDRGPERTLVNINGDNFLSTAYWDIGSASEQALAGGFLGSYLFSVPQGASLGVHQVGLQRSGKRGNTRPFTVTAAQPFSGPRLDRISIVSASFSTTSGKVNTWLYVQAANADVDAEVLIDNIVKPTVAHKGIQNDLQGINPTDLGYPIYHYLAFIVAPGELNTGQTINVRIRNSDGQLSAVKTYKMPQSDSTLDSDGDNIPDLWEKNGYDADNDGVVDIDLKALGADPLRPDVFIEIDIMNGLTNNPTNAVWNVFRNTFANAPIINPGKVNGINLVLDTSGSVPFWDAINFNGTETTTFRRFNTLKNTNFNDAIRGRIYHYGIWANSHPAGWSGISDVDWTDGGDDFIVSFDDFSNAYQTVQSMAETVMHEFGHNLNQKHGGVNHVRYNPVYSSVMSYSWQLRSGSGNGFRRNNPIYAPLYYQLNNAVENNGATPAAWTPPTIDYSEGMGRSLQENNLDETVGLYNGNAIDWNGNGNATDTGVSRDLTGDGDTNDTLVDYANWANLVYRGPEKNGTN